MNLYKLIYYNDSSKLLTAKPSFSFSPFDVKSVLSLSVGEFLHLSIKNDCICDLLQQEKMAIYLKISSVLGPNLMGLRSEKIVVVYIFIFQHEIHNCKHVYMPKMNQIHAKS